MEGISSMLDSSFPLNGQREKEIKRSFKSASAVPAIPANSFQLESDFRKLKGCSENLYLYLKVWNVVLIGSARTVSSTDIEEIG